MKCVLLAVAVLASGLLSADPVRLMSFNIRHGEGMDGKVDHARIARIFADARPDFVGVQEVDAKTGRVGGLDVPAELSRLTGLHATYSKSIDYDGGEYGNLVLSRRKPLDVKRYPLPGDEPRSLVLCEFPDCVFGTTHLCVADPAHRQASVAIIRRAVEEYAVRKPVFLTGDWNSLPESETLADMGKFMVVLSGRLEATYHGDLDCAPAEMSRAKDHCIDYIAVDRAHAADFEVGESRVLPERTASDHAPLLVEFEKGPAWIAGPYEPPAETNAAAFFADAPNDLVEKRFFVRDAEIRRAVWRVAAPGLRDLSVNGERIAPTALPPWTPYGKRILEESFDVTERIRRGGENVLRVELGNGWYNPLPLKFWYYYNLREALAVGTPCVRATLEISFADGRRNRIRTDGSWRAARGQKLGNSIYLGEKVDFRRTVSFDGAARPVKGPRGDILPAEDFPKNVIYQRWPAKSVTAVSNGVWLVDMGVNFAGTFRMKLHDVKDGQIVRFRKGELRLADGSVNVMSAVAGQIKKPDRGPLFAVAEECDTLVCAEAPEAVYEPRLSFHVFRYIQVEGLSRAPQAGDVEALAWSADVHDRSAFSCSNERMNRLHEICRRTFRANLQSVQSDCPGREKFGYGGDIACTAEAFWCNYDMRAFYRKTVRDFIDEAKDDGILTETAPYVGIASNGVFPRDPKTGRGSAPMGWAVGLPVLLESLVRYAGDAEIVREAYPTLTRYIALVRERYPTDEIPECLGDWIPAVAEEKADAKMSALAHWHQFVRLTAGFARLLGKEEDARRYGEMASEIAGRFVRRHVKGGIVARGSQGDQLFGLYHGLVPDRDEAYARLRADIIRRGDSLSTGIFATRYLLELLPQFGDWELAGRVVAHEGYPGWMNMLDRGATTLWEHWDERQCLNIHSNCHPMFGSVDAWLIQHVLGIRVCEGAVGCDRVSIEPHAVAGVTEASGWFDTPKGRISVRWMLKGNQMDVDVHVPDGIERIDE